MYFTFSVINNYILKKSIDYFLWKLGSVFLISKKSLLSISIPVNAAVIKAKSKCKMTNMQNISKY